MALSKAFVEDLGQQDPWTVEIQRKILQTVMAVTSIISLFYSAYFIYHLGPQADLLPANVLFLSIGANYWLRRTSIKPVILDGISIFSTYLAFSWVAALLGRDSGINLTALCSFMISLLMFFPRYTWLIAASLLCSLSLFLSPLLAKMDSFYGHYRIQLAALPAVRTQMEMALYVVVILTCYLFAVFWASRILALKREKTEKENYLRILTHDLKHPVVHSLLAVRRLKEAGLSANEDIRALEIAQFTVKEIINNVENIDGQELDLSHSQSEFSIFDCLDKVVPWLESRLREKQLTIDCSAADPRHRMTCHFESMTYQVLQNIITNAIKFSNVGSIIRVSTERTEGSVRWLIADSGKGISDHDLAVKSKPETGTLGEIGTGLGIKIIRQFAAKSRVEVSWQKMNGTTVIITQAKRNELTKS